MLSPAVEEAADAVPQRTWHRRLERPAEPQHLYGEVIDGRKHRVGQRRRNAERLASDPDFGRSAFDTCLVLVHQRVEAAVVLLLIDLAPSEPLGEQLRGSRPGFGSPAAHGSGTGSGPPHQE
jgi:hypothetical protein